MRPILFVGLILSLAGCGSPSTDDWLAQLKDPEVVKRRQAVRELGAKSAEAQRVVPALAEVLRDENGHVRHDAAMVLGKFGPDALEAVPALTLALKDNEKNVRTAAAAALKKIDAHAAHKAG